MTKSCNNKPLLSTEANSGITDLKEELVTKSRDLDVIRECLVDLRAQVTVALCVLIGGINAKGRLITVIVTNN